MKKTLLFLTLLFAANTISFAQTREIARGATPGELYLSDYWYTVLIYNFYADTVQKAIFHITENGKKLTIQYHADVWNEPLDSLLFEMNYIVADATPGVLYNVRRHNSLTLWVSFDYGKNWTFKEDNVGRQYYYATNKEGMIYRAAFEWFVIGTYKSYDYGTNFTIVYNYCISAEEPGIDTAEFFTFNGINPYKLLHTYDLFTTYTVSPIDEQYVNGKIWGCPPIVCRGGLKNEVYLASLFSSDKRYRVSFSADTGHTFRHVYVSDEVYSSYSEYYPLFMTDREPGGFYIIKRQNVYGYNLQHLKICIEYYRDYGEILEATFCHDLNKNYEYEEVICENVTSLVLETISQNSVQLQWASTIDNSCIRGYHIYRNNERITNQLLIEPNYLDEYLPGGIYEYYVRTYFKEGCVSDSSNHVKVEIELGVKGVMKLEGAILYPNPTTGGLTIELRQAQLPNGELRINYVEIFDVFGKQISSHHLIASSSHYHINILHLHAGIYFVKITTENGIVTKKVVKY